MMYDCIAQIAGLKNFKQRLKLYYNFDSEIFMLQSHKKCTLRQLLCYYCYVNERRDYSRMSTKFEFIEKLSWFQTFI